jgi:hypothetical protein
MCKSESFRTSTVNCYCVIFENEGTITTGAECDKKVFMFHKRTDYDPDLVSNIRRLLVTRVSSSSDTLKTIRACCSLGRVTSDFGICDGGIC